MGLLLASAAMGCGRNPDRQPVERSTSGSSPAAGSTPAAQTAGPRLPRFVDRASDTGLVFVHANGMSGARHFPEIMGPGVGVFDMDNDGDLDVFVPQGRPLGATAAAASDAPTSTRGGRLFRNDLQVAADGRRTLRFTDVTDASGIRALEYGMGVAAGDVDNDGWIDLYLTNFGRNQLYRNNGDGTFTDVSASSGTDAPGWSVPAVFFDYDRDGRLDLFVGQYVRYTVQTNIPCRTVAGALDYCAPFVYPSQPSRLYRNMGRGRFTDVTTPAGLGVDFGPALGASTADYNGDGWIDLYVAHDLQPNTLWINQGNGTFANTAAASGVAVGQNGEPKSSMGVDAADFDNDGDEDLFVTELTGQGADLYVNDGTGQFTDASAASGLRAATLPLTGFGTAWLDADRDGWLDLVTVNGLVMGGDASAPATDPFPFRQPRQLLRNLGNGRFADVSRDSGPAFARTAVGRGLAVGDLDNDGDLDLIVANDNDRLELLLDESERPADWTGVRLVSREGRDATGARVGLRRGDGTTVWRRARADGSYASSHDPRVIVGLNGGPLTGIEIVWPGGERESFPAPPAGRYSTVTQGSGSAIAGSTR